MTTWEYFVDTVTDSDIFITGSVPSKDLTQRLNSHGQQGWELVTSYATTYAQGGTHMLVFIYRRAKGSVEVPPVSTSH